MEMMSAIAKAFEKMRAGSRTGLVAYVTAGDPDLDRTAEILASLAANGADVLEVGIPFSDPLADGPVIQRASERALASKTTLRGVLRMIREHRSRIAAPIVLFTYANPILRVGEEAFVAEAAAAGVDGVLVLDLPVEEAGPFRARLAGAKLDPIFLLSPTTTDERIRASATMGSGFLYVISRLGVTGARDRVATDAEPLVKRIRAQSDLPLALGFGISRPEHVAEVGRWADAAVVGSALVNVIAEHGRSPDVAAKAGDYVRWLKGQA
jgi:tryptophan synthase alpha chain